MLRRAFDRQRDGGERCHHCGAATGEFHSLGCMGEECPKCGNLLVTCSCNVMDVDDKALAVRRLYNAMNNLMGAWAFAAQYSYKSIIGLAGWLWACLHAEPDLIAAMVLTDAGALAKARPSLCDATGYPRYSVADIARALGLGKREVVELEKVFHDVTVAQKTDGFLRVN